MPVNGNETFLEVYAYAHTIGISDSASDKKMMQPLLLLNMENTLASKVRTIFSRSLGLPPDPFCINLTLREVVCTLIVAAQVALHALHEVRDIFDTLVSDFVLISAVVHWRVRIPADRYATPAIVQRDVVEELAP